MVSKLVYWDEDITRSSFLVSSENIFVKNNRFQEAGLMENIAQTAALSAGYTASTENKPAVLGYIGAVSNFEVYDLPKVNDELITEITVENRIFEITVLSGKVWHKNNLVAKCEMKLFSSNK
jgi:predicted hotdog family 3-hydroxylacyl-ACP dehydratase